MCLTGIKANPAGVLSSLSRLETLLGLLQTRSSLRVEWYIVLLIVAELLLTTYSLLFNRYKRGCAANHHSADLCHGQRSIFCGPALTLPASPRWHSTGFAPIRSYFV